MVGLKLTKWVLLAEAAVIVAIVNLSGCLDTGVKKLGDTSSDSSPTVVNNTDPFAITLVYHNNSSATNLAYQVVGATDTSSESFASSCGSDGSSCICKFYQSTSDTHPLTSASVTYSLTNNTITCTLPSGSTPASYNYVQLQTTGGTLTSGLINVVTSLTLQQSLNSTTLSASAVRKIYNYSCTRTFLEGEGVNFSTILCSSGQHLGFIYANYHYYLYQSESGTDKNVGTPGTTGSFTYYNANGTPPGVCAKTVAQFSCGTQTAAPIFGLYPASAGQFTQPVTLQASPSIASATYGYAALPDATGTCPVGLVPISNYIAQPYSILQNSLGSNPPSSFINNGGTLNDSIWQPSSAAVSSFSIFRAPNATPCCSTSACQDSQGNYQCNNSTVGGTSALTPVAYGVQTPTLCAIPASAL